jgi:glycosyltransferase involved in cell wall biosynthesis
MKHKTKVAYLIAGEHLTEPLLRRQVVELLGEIKKKADLGTGITLFLFYPIPSVYSRRADLRVTRRRLSELGIAFVVIPTLCPWPIPNFKMRKVAEGWRPVARWSRWSLRLFKLHTLPVLLWIRLTGGYRVFHCRSYPATSAAVFLKRFLPRTAILFDPRSDFPEENVTAGNWERDSDDFRYWKSEEGRLLRRSDAVACIAQSYIEAFRRSTPNFNYFLVPNNVNCAEFRNDATARRRIRNSLGIGEHETAFVYLGNLASSGWHQASFYRVFYENLTRFVEQPVFFFLVPERSVLLVHEAFSGCGRIIVKSPQYDEIAEYLSAADIGMMFLHKAKVALGTKIVEYLAASLPVIVNRNCEGAVSLIRENSQLGCVVDLGLGDRDDGQQEFKEGTVRRIQELLNTAGTLEDFAWANFDNSTVATRYAKQYSRMQALVSGSWPLPGAHL